MSNIYTQEFLHYYKSQPYKKKLSNFTNTGKEVNLSCGDEIMFELNVKDNKIEKIGYQSTGCAISEGAASILSEYIEGKKLDELKKLTKEDFFKLLGIELTPSRENCALLAFNALKIAIGSNPK